MTAGKERGKAPDFPLTRLAMRAWQLDRAALMIRSLNSPVSARKASWMAKAMASPEGNWPYDKPLQAACSQAGQQRKKDDDTPEHGPVPSAECSCGIYATTDLDVINGYLARSAPVLGIVEMGGRVIPATQGYRAEYARLAVVLLVDEALTEPHALLRKLAAAYRVPAAVPHSADPEDYRELAGMTSIAGEAEEFLRQIQDGTQ